MCVCEHLFFTNVNAWVYTCVCERACVHKVPPCKCLSVCGEQQPHPARHEAGTEKTRAPNIQRPPGHGPPGEPPQGQPRPPPRKGQRRARRRDPWQPQCRRPRVPWRQARRLHRQSTTPGRTFCFNYCLNSAWHGGDQFVALLRWYGSPGFFDSGLQLICIVGSGVSHLPLNNTP